MSIKHHYKKLISLFLSFVICGGLVATSVIRYDSNDTIMNVRRIDVNQLSFGERAEALLNQFNMYETSNTATTITFEGDMHVSIGEIIGFDSLAYQENTVTKKISSKYDFETNTFYMNVSYYSDNELLEFVETEVEPQYDEIRDDGFIYYNEEKYYFSETFDAGSLNECIALVDDVAVLGAGVVIVAGIAVILIASPPTVRQEIIKTLTTITETIAESVKSFFKWFTKWITRTRTVETTTIVETLTPSLTIDKVRIETREITIDQIKKLPHSTYFLAFADISNGKMYFSLSNITYAQAVAVMAYAMPQNCIADSKYQMIASVYTYAQSYAFTIMDSVGYNNRTPKWNPEREHDLYHYHSRAEIKITTTSGTGYHSPHLFFALYN